MSVEGQLMVFVWALVSAAVFLVAALSLDSKGIKQKDKVWIGRIGLAAPLWPLMAVGAVVVILALMARELVRAASGKP